MSTIMAAVLVAAGPILALVFAVGVVAVFGLVAWDAFSRRGLRASQADAAAVASLGHEHAVTRMYIERGVARTFVILGASFWGVCSLAAALLYQRGSETLLFIALLPFLMNIACLIIGWRWERTASVMLTLTAAAAIGWGVAVSFEAGVWMLVVLLLVGPMLTAAVLFWLARQGEIDLARYLAPQPEMAVATVER